MLKFDDYNIPDRTAQSLKEYIERGVPVGNFLHCVLSNDLLGAVRHADKFNKPAIQEIVRWIDAHALLPIEGGRLNHFIGDDFVLENFLPMINVVDEGVQLEDALLEAALNPIPLLRAHDAGDQIERKNTFSSVRVAVDVEGDAQLQQKPFGGALAAFELAVFQVLNGFEEEPGFGPCYTARVEHFIVKIIGLVIIKTHDGYLQIQQSLPDFGRHPPGNLIQRFD